MWGLVVALVASTKLSWSTTACDSSGRLVSRVYGRRHPKRAVRTHQLIMAYYETFCAAYPIQHCCSRHDSTTRGPVCSATSMTLMTKSPAEPTHSTTTTTASRTLTLSSHPRKNRFSATGPFPRVSYPLICTVVLSATSQCRSVDDRYLRRKNVDIVSSTRALETI